MPPIYVTAIYKIYEKGYDTTVWERLRTLATSVKELHCICSAADRSRAETISNLIPHYHEFETLETYKLLSQAKILPTIRKASKDTKEFMILMNAKTEFINIVRSKGFFSSHYVWLDAGISKIFKDPLQTLSDLYMRLEKPKKSSHIFIPGCHKPQQDKNYLGYCINWRFCGGFFVVPEELVVPFYSAVLHACEEFLQEWSIAIWEVNIWAFIESRLPIQWEHGDHDERMFHSISKYLL